MTALRKADKMDGQDNYMYPKNQLGYKLTGSFEKGVPVGKCMYYTESMKSYNTDWANGKCIKVYE